MTTITREQPAMRSWLGGIAQERPTSFALGFVAGFVDIASYVALFGLFSANMTGNVLLAAVALVQPNGDITASRVIAVPLFMLGVALGWLCAFCAKRWHWPVNSVLFTGEATALILFLVTGVLYAPQLHTGDQQTLIIAIGSCALIAMGLQNALARELFATMPATTGMTSNLSLFVLDIAELIYARLVRQSLTTQPSPRDSYARAVPVLGGFVFGAMAGGYGVHYFGFWSIVLPIAVLMLLAAVTPRLT